MGGFGQHWCPVPPQINRFAPRAITVQVGTSPAWRHAAFIAIYYFLCNKTLSQGPFSAGVIIFFFPGHKGLLVPSVTQAGAITALIKAALLSGND